MNARLPIVTRLVRLLTGIGFQSTDDSRKLSDATPKAATVSPSTDTRHGFDGALRREYDAVANSAITAPQSAGYSVTIREAVLGAPCSMRLRNLVINNELFGEWSVRQALSAETDFVVELFRIHGFGRKAVDELLSLLRAALQQAPAPQQDNSRENCGPQTGSGNLAAAGQPVNAVGLEHIEARLLELPLGRILAFFGCSGRLENAIARADLNDICFADYLSSPSILATRLRELQGIGQKTIDEAIDKVEQFMAAALRADPSVRVLLAPAEEADSAAPTSTDPLPETAATTNSPEGFTDTRPLRERLADIVTHLPGRARYVLVWRYGLDGQPTRTLQEIADEVFVTRERIRQLEAHALRAIGVLANRSLLLELLRNEDEAIWATLSGGAGLITDAVFAENRRRLDPWQVLAIETTYGDVRDWLRQKAVRMNFGWLRAGVQVVPRVGAAERSITGHIDFLQVRNGAVHVLDYKPDARTNKPIAQLAIYALALTRLVPGLKLFDIKCAWFNEEEYCEFFPRTLFVRPILSHKGG